VSKIFDKYETFQSSFCLVYNNNMATARSLYLSTGLVPIIIPICDRHVKCCMEIGHKYTYEFFVKSFIHLKNYKHGENAKL
jgi:hypothetical protein